MDGNWQDWLHRGLHVSLASVLAKSCKVPVWITALVSEFEVVQNDQRRRFEVSELTCCPPAKQKLILTAWTVQEFGHKVSDSSAVGEVSMFSYQI